MLDNAQQWIFKTWLLTYHLSVIPLQTNDSKACVKWCHNLTAKGNWHIEYCKKAMKEWVKDGSTSISHVSGRTNPSDIFTKEMQDGSNFRCLRSSFVSCRINFLRGTYNNLHPYSKPLEVPNLPVSQMLVAQWARCILLSTPGILDIIILHKCFHLLLTILPFQFWAKYPILYYVTYFAQVTMSNPMGGGSVGYSYRLSLTYFI